MNDYQSLSHSKWECKYHVVFIPKYRRKVMYGQLRRHLGEVFRALAPQQESVIVEGIYSPITCICCSDFAQICGGAGGRVSQRQECNSHRPDVWGPRAQFCR